MRIYFVGAHATGKTTMTRYVSKRYNLPMISEVARGVLAELEASLGSLRTDMDLVGHYQRKVFERQIEIEKKQQSGFVSDRAFDNLAYAAEHTTILGELMSELQFREYMEWVQRGIVFFVRPQRELLPAAREDSVREALNWESVVRIDGMIKLLLEQFRISYLPIAMPSMQERVRAIEFTLDRLVHKQEELPIIQPVPIRPAKSS
jgi:hypothetical protein